jgi:hypothetical protein
MTAATSGHRVRVSYRVVVQCECEWESATYCGKGARAFAYEEWRQHIDACKAKGAKPASP